MSRSSTTTVHELASATVTLTNGEPLGGLTFNGPAPGSIFVFGSGTHQITLSGAASAADYQTALRQITFNNTGTNPSTETRVIDIVVNDGARNSNTAQALIQVEVVNNSAPVLDLDADNSSGSFQSTFRNAFTENGAPVPIADVDTSITDADSTTLVSATIKLANPETGDLLTVSGVLPGTITTAGYDPVTGVLTLTGSGTLADYEAALKQIRYSNTSDDPVPGDRLIEVVVNDGANNSNLAVAIISVTATNDAPVITVDPAAAYVENAAGVVLAPTAALSDLDDTELDGALVSITAGSFPGDGDILSVGGVTSNTVNGITFVWMPAQHALVFTGVSSVANYQALLRQVQFQSSSDNPTDFSHSPQRTLTWAVTDSESVTTATTTINIVAVNDAPQETVAATAAYTENGSPVTISPAATASDVDNSDLIYGGVRIVAGGFDGDILTVNGLQSGTFLGNRLFLRCRLAPPSVQCPGRGRGLPGAHAGGRIRVDQREPDELRRQSDAHTGVGFVRRRELRFPRADDADHHHRPERRPGQHRAGRADRRRGHHPADRRRLGGGQRQQRAHHHAVGR